MLAEVYPKSAQALGIGGYAKFTCTVTERGALTACRVVDEEPKGYGFGEAALSLAPKIRFRPRTEDGQSVAGATVSIPIRFAPPGAPLPPKLPRTDQASLALARRISYLPAFSEVIENSYREEAGHVHGNGDSRVSSAAEPRLSAALEEAIQSKHADLLEALAIAHAAIMGRSELETMIAAQTPDVQSPDAVKRLRRVSDIVYPWYRATIFVDVR